MGPAGIQKCRQAGGLPQSRVKRQKTREAPPIKLPNQDNGGEQPFTALRPGPPQNLRNHLFGWQRHARRFISY